MVSDIAHGLLLACIAIELVAHDNGCYKVPCPLFVVYCLSSTCSLHSTENVGMIAGLGKVRMCVPTHVHTYVGMRWFCMFEICS